jgi:hypothetical protein
MPCSPLISGFTIDCPKDSKGGLRFIRIAMLQDVDSYEETGGAISKIIMKPGKAFFGFNFPKNTSSFVITPTPNEQAGSYFYGEALTLIINKMKLSTSLVFESLARNPLVIIAEDMNGLSMLLGRVEGVNLSGGSITSGVAMGDRNGYEIQFAGEEARLTHMAEAYIIQEQGSCYLVDRLGNRFVDETGGGLYIPCSDGSGDFALIDFSDDFSI